MNSENSRKIWTTYIEIKANLSIYDTWKNIKSSYNNNKFQISTPTCNEEFILPDGSYSVSDIQDYFEYILKKHRENIDKPSIQIYINKIENRITFKIKKGYSLEHIEYIGNTV